ncbi:MAG: hypothetical protein WCJ64_14650 [Rhodospirillaceae bacterium]
MSSLFSTPKVPDGSALAAAVAPASEPPPEPVIVSTPAPLPTPTIAPLPTPTVATDPALAAQIDPTAAAANALAMRNRGIQGTITTSLVGVPAAVAALGASAAGGALDTNALLPQRKTLLGE